MLALTFLGLGACSLALARDESPSTKAQLAAVAASPYEASLSYLITQYTSNPTVPRALDAVVRGLKDTPPGYNNANPWKKANSGDQLLSLMVKTFLKWCVFLPQINGTHDNGLDYI